MHYKLHKDKPHRMQKREPEISEMRLHNCNLRLYCLWPVLYVGTVDTDKLVALRCHIHVYLVRERYRFYYYLKQYRKKSPFQAKALRR